MGRYAELVTPLSPEGREEVCFELINLMPESVSTEEAELFGDPIGDAIVSTLVPEVYADKSEDDEALYDLILRDRDVQLMLKNALGVLLAERRLPNEQVQFCGHLLGIEVIRTPELVLSY